MSVLCVDPHFSWMNHSFLKEGSPDCWANHWHNPPRSPRTVLIQSEKRGWKNHSGPLTPLFELLLSSWRYRALSTRMARHRNSFFPQAIHLMNTWHETWNTQHNYTLFIHHTFLLIISNLHISDLYTQHWLYYIYILVFCTLPIFIIVYYSFIICVLFCCCRSVALWSFCHYNKFLVCVNIPGQ